MAKSKRGRFFRRKSKLVLLDERVPPLVLPPPPMNISFEEDDVIYGEDIDEEIVEPLRIFIGSGATDSQTKQLDHIWDVDDDLSFEDSEEEAPLQISIGGIAAVKEDAPPLSLGVATLTNTSLPEEVFDDFVTEEMFVRPIPEDDEQNSVEYSISKAEWLYTTTEQENKQKSIATLNTALLPIEDEVIVLEGELDFSQLDISQTIDEIEARKKQFENELSNEDWEHVLTLDDISPNDYDVPELFGNRKKEKELQPIFMDAETEILEQTEIIHRTAPIHIATKKKQSPPYVEMAIAFAGTFCTLLLLWSLLS